MIVQELMQQQRYELVRILAEGSYGKVLLARDNSNQQDLAFKVFTMEVNEGDEGADDDDDSNLKGRRKFTEDEEEIKGHVQEATPSIRKKQGMLRHFMNEVLVLKKLVHPNIV